MKTQETRRSQKVRAIIFVLGLVFFAVYVLNFSGLIHSSLLPGQVSGSLFKNHSGVLSGTLLNLNLIGRVSGLKRAVQLNSGHFVFGANGYKIILSGFFAFIFSMILFSKNWLTIFNLKSGKSCASDHSVYFARQKLMPAFRAFFI